VIEFIDKKVNINYLKDKTSAVCFTKEFVNFSFISYRNMSCKGWKGIGDSGEDKSIKDYTKRQELEPLSREILVLQLGQ